MKSISHGLLEGKRGLIFGAVDSRSLAWHVASRCAEQGAQLVLTNTHNAVTLADVAELASRLNVPLIECDATDVEQLNTLIDKATESLGGKLDFVLHAVACSDNIRRHRSYDNLNYNYMLRTVDVSAVSLHKFLETALRHDAIAYGGSVVALSYIGSSLAIHNYCDMGDAKAMLESIVRQFGLLYGERCGVRINSLSQSPTPTRASAGCKEIDSFRRMTDLMAPLGNADADSCADMCVMLFSDYTRFVTMQNIYNDGGYSKTGLSERFAQYARSLFNSEDDN